MKASVRSNSARIDAAVRCAAVLLASIGLALTGCQKQAPAPTAKPTASKPASPAAPAAANSSPTAATGQAPAANAASPEAKPKGITEEEGEQETVEEGNAATQPALRLGIPAPAVKPSHFREGTHYQRLLIAQPTGVAPDQIEVLEVFSYGCAPCQALDQALDNWTKKSKPLYVVVTRLPAMTTDLQRLQARAFFTLAALGKADINTALLRDTATKPDAFATLEKISATLREHGVTAEELRKTFTADGVEANLAHAELMNRRYRIDTTPVVIVNGKFVTDLNRAGGESELLKLVAELADNEHRD